MNKASCDVIVQVEKSKVYNGPLTPWNDEEEFFWEFSGRPFGAVSLNIVKAIVLQQPATMHRPEKLKALIWSPAVAAENLDVSGAVVPPFLQETLDKPAALQALGVSGQDLEHFIREPVCLAIPSAVLALIKRGAWRNLILLGTWHHKKRGKAYLRFATELDLPAWHLQLKQSNLLRLDVPKPSLGFPAASALDLAKSLQIWAPAILASHPEVHDGVQTNIFLEDIILRLQSYASHQGAASISQHPRSKKLDHDKVVKALCVSMKLRNKSELTSALSMAIDAVFPGMSRDVPISMPSGPSLSRKQILVDAAYCCFWRDVLAKQEGPIYLWCDASPQGGVEWLLSIINCIEKADLPKCTQPADYLRKSVQDLQRACSCDDKDAMLDIAKSRHEAGSVLKKAIVSHRQIPIGLGSATVEHKVRSVCRKLFVETQTLED